MYSRVEVLQPPPPIREHTAFSIARMRRCLKTEAGETSHEMLRRHRRRDCDSAPRKRLSCMAQNRIMVQTSGCGEAQTDILAVIFRDLKQRRCDRLAEITYAELLRLGVTQQSYSAQEAKAVLQEILGTGIVGNATTGVDPLQDGIWCLTGFGNNGKWREVGRSGTTMRFRAAQNSSHSTTPSAFVSICCGHVERLGGAGKSAQRGVSGADSRHPNVHVECDLPYHRMPHPARV